MIQPRIPRVLEDRLSRRINRAPSPLLALSVPWIVVMLGSLAPTWPVIASAPLLPPLGFMLLLAWRQVRPGLLPVWAGLPLGAFDDVFSGQPFGSAVLLWSLAMIALDAIEARFPWRSFALDWVEASLLLLGFLAGSLLLANAAGGSAALAVIAPQFMLAVLLYPLVGRIVAAFDRFRLLPLMEIG